MKLLNLEDYEIHMRQINMKTFKFRNNITGWIIFLIALVVYLLTIEPTTSFWDCGEFISSAYKLEVGHPPGAPFFMLLARFFSLFAGSNATNVAAMINSLSALVSAFTILFLFWTITHLAGKFFKNNGGKSKSVHFLILGSGIVGALAYTFSDTFWFSAVEGEVYATSSLFTAVVFWAILKWENVADEKYANRWLILICYLMGLSIGVHLLNLLALPAIVFVYYFRKYKPSKKGIITATLVAIVLLGSIMYIIIPGVVRLATIFELLCVNVLSLPYHSGAIVYVIILITLIAWSIRYTVKKQKTILNTVITGITVILIGYSSYALILIRSDANPPMDQSNPDNLFSLLSYLNREQYGSRPLIYGQYYSAPLRDIKDGKRLYARKDGKYIVTMRKPEYVYDSRFTTLFPRMYSREDKHIQAYKEWAEIKGVNITLRDGQGESRQVTKPTFAENLKFFFSYQLGYMYFRYFMWNFAGRQNDIQGHGSILKGNWLSGINFLDDWRLGDQENIPGHLKNNPARNRYYFLPLILGLLGLIFHYRRDKKNFWVIMLLFFFTGIAIVIYLNQTPHQPRERDYAYAGSFYAFSIWIGLGVYAIATYMNKILPYRLSVGISILAGFIFVPLLMAFENRDDHDRSGRYTARDFAGNYLNSCAPDAILFTNGDNDTFPLWYAQEVEGIRTDVRVVNLSYLGGDWYIDQMKIKAYESDPVPFSLSKDKYIQGTRDVVLFNEKINGYYDLKELIDFVASDARKTKTPSPFARDELLDFFPTKKFLLKIDSANVLNNGTVPARLAGKILKEMKWEYPSELVYKNDLMVLDLLANNNWNRPIYIAITVPGSAYMGLKDFFQVEGLAYRIVPVKVDEVDGFYGRIESEIMYDNLMNKFKWGGATDPEVYLDENNKRMLSNFRSSFTRLAFKLIKEEKNDSARKVIERSMELFPNERVPYGYFSVQIPEVFYRLGNIEEANKITNEIADMYISELGYYFSLEMKFSKTLQSEKQLGLQILQELIQLTELFQQNELNDQLKEKFNAFYALYRKGA